MTSTTALTAINSPESSEIFCVLLTIHDPSEATTVNDIRVSTDNADTFDVDGQDVRGITYGGLNYIWFPFEISLPEISGETSPMAELRISGVDGRVISAIRAISVAPQIDISVILTSQRAVGGYTPEVTLPGFRLRSATYDATSVSGTLTFEDLLSEPYPYKRMNPTDFPGLFK